METHSFMMRPMHLTVILTVLLGISAVTNVNGSPEPCYVGASDNGVFNDSGACQEAEVNADPEGYTLSHVVILSRHSMRAPLTDVLLNDSVFPLGLGFSTAVGNKFSVKVGKIWRNFYGDFVKNTNIRQTWIRSSSAVRCAETQQLVLQQMLLPEGDFYFGLPIQPIVSIKLPVGNDVNVETCGAETESTMSHLDELTDNVLARDGFSTFGDFAKFILFKTGHRSNETDLVVTILDGLHCAKYNQLPIPDWAEERWNSIDFGLRLLVAESPINQLSYFGNYLGKFLAERLLTFAEGPFQHRFSFLSYHDTNIIAVLKALGNDAVELAPSFLGALHLQVYKRDSDGDFFVRAMYHQGATPDLEYRKAREITLKNCPFPECTLWELAKILSQIYDDVDRSRCGIIDPGALL